MKPISVTLPAHANSPKKNQDTKASWFKNLWNIMENYSCNL